MRIFFLYIISIFIFSHCQFSVKNPQNSLSEVSHQNIQLKVDRLQNLVNNHFSEKDTLQKTFADFLFENLKYHHHQWGLKEQTYISLIQENYTNPTNLEVILDSMKHISFSNSKDQLDVEILSDTELVNHINNVVNIYVNSPVISKIPFDIFCNYVLPYKVHQEQAFQFWAALEADTDIFNQTLDSIINYAFVNLHQANQNFKIVWGSKSLNIPPLPLNMYEKLQIGSCEDVAYASIGKLRKLGIPCTIDFIPTYLNYSGGHSWNAIVLDSIHTIPFQGDVPKTWPPAKPFRVSSIDTIPFIQPAAPVRYKVEKHRISKVFRYGFKPVANSHVMKRGQINELPEHLNNYCLKDVTSQYTKVSNIQVKLNTKRLGKIHDAMQNEKMDEYAYLAVFNKPHWQIVDWGYNKDGQAVFKNIGRGGVYLPMVLIADIMMPAGDAFILQEDGSISYLTPKKHTLPTIKLNRKYPDSPHYYDNRMVGGKIQAANIPDFSDAVDLYKITKSPGHHFNTISLEGNQKYRYIRYLAPKYKQGHVAELEFYENSNDPNPIKGKIMGTEAYLPNTSKEKAMDGNLLTYFESPVDDAWIGIELKESMSIQKIRYLERNDLNDIYENNEYELLYWDNEWKSLGKQVADTTYLEYKNVKEDVLLWLKNNTTGNEERIFTIDKKGVQHWW